MQPTNEQQEQALLVQHDIVELLARLSREGIPATIIMTGAAAALADVLSRTWGEKSVAKWFFAQWQVAHEILGKDS